MRDADQMERIRLKIAFLMKNDPDLDEQEHTAFCGMFLALTWALEKGPEILSAFGDVDDSMQEIDEKVTLESKGDEITALQDWFKGSLEDWQEDNRIAEAARNN